MTNSEGDGQCSVVKRGVLQIRRKQLPAWVRSTPGRGRINFSSSQSTLVMTRQYRLLRNRGHNPHQKRCVKNPLPPVNERLANGSKETPISRKN